MAKSKIILFTLRLILAGVFGWTVVLADPIPAPAATSSTDSNNAVGYIDRTHSKASQIVLDTAKWLDDFFDDKRSSDVANESRIKWRGSVFTDKTNGFGYSSDFDIRLSLPKTENRLFLLINGNPNNDESLDDSPLDEARRSFEERDQRNSNIALRFFPEFGPSKNISVDVGLAFRELTPYPYVGGLYRHLWDLDPWQARFIQYARYYTKWGLEALSRLDLERSLGKLFFRTSTEWYWYEDTEDGWISSLRFFLYQPLDKRKAISYEWSNYFNTSPQFVCNTLVARARYRQQIWRSWLFFEIVPQVAYRAIDDWELDPGILVRLEVNFGFD